MKTVKAIERKQNTYKFQNLRIEPGQRRTPTTEGAFPLSRCSIVCRVGCRLSVTQLIQERSTE